jgi:hypothetical protein
MMREQTACETDEREVEASENEASPLPDRYRITPSRGYFYPQKQVGDVWLYFPINGPLLIEEIHGAKRCRTYENAAKYVNRHARSEQKAGESGLFDGLPTMREYDYSGAKASRRACARRSKGNAFLAKYYPMNSSGAWQSW